MGSNHAVKNNLQFLMNSVKLSDIAKNGSDS
jgi:hypothetical protein